MMRALPVLHANVQKAQARGIRAYVLGMGNYSITMIIVIVLLAIIKIVYFPLTSGN